LRPAYAFRQEGKLVELDAAIEAFWLILEEYGKQDEDGVK
jgi:hypothetical protein